MRSLYWVTDRAEMLEARRDNGELVQYESQGKGSSVCAARLCPWSLGTELDPRPSALGTPLAETELLGALILLIWSGKRDSNPRPSAWEAVQAPGPSPFIRVQGRALGGRCPPPDSRTSVVAPLRPFLWLH